MWRNLNFTREINTCSCGRIHRCPIDRVVIGKSAVAALKELDCSYRSIAVVGDDNTYGLYGELVCRHLRVHGRVIKPIVLANRQSQIIIPNEHSIGYLETQLPEDCDLIVAVGSGVINDLCKYVSYCRKIPYLIVATAPSMDGYASAGAALILKGMKVTLQTHVPLWIVGDTEILRESPSHMIRAGVGDILGKISALNDWKLSALLNGEFYCPQIYQMVERRVEILLRDLDAIVERFPQAIADLMESLVLVGIAMAYVGNSRPASGSEHHLSHFFEITGLLNNTPYLAHGLDVGYATVLTTYMRRRLAAMTPADFRARPGEMEQRRELARVYSGLTDEVINLRDKTGYCRLNRAEFIRDNWQNVRKILLATPDEQYVIDALQRSGFAIEEFRDLYSESLIRDAIIYAKDLKERYTVLWLADETGLLHEIANDVTLWIPTL